MSKVVKLLTVFGLILLTGSMLQAQIVLDGDSTDWQAEPVLVEWIENPDGFYPEEIGAAITDVVDIKQVKAKVEGNALYFFMRMWGGPVWPNLTYQNDDGHPGATKSRGYYHVMIDLDNDPATGWDSKYYEGHETPVGYVMRTLPGLGYDAVGAEMIVEVGMKGFWTDDTSNVHNMLDGVEYWAGDFQEYDAENDTGTDYDMYAIEVNRPDSSEGMAIQYCARVAGSSDDGGLDGDETFSYWGGHAWADGTGAEDNFLEFGHELTVIKKYWENKGYPQYLTAGSTIGIAGFNETPIDDWGCDVTNRGEYTLPAEIPERPSRFTFDGDSSDWAAIPNLVEWIENPDGFYPEEIGAAITDIVDVRAVKALIDETAVYWFVRMWGGPAWPNHAYQNDDGHPGLTYSRGYYHLGIDFDNDVATGWNTGYYEGHETPVGYVMRTLPGLGYDAIGAEVMIGIGLRYCWADESRFEKHGGVRYISHYGADVEGYDAQNDTGESWDIYDMSLDHPDSSYGMYNNGMLVVADSEDESLPGGAPVFVAHAWGHDFIEAAHGLAPIKKYWMNKHGTDPLPVGATVGVCAMNETPIDDWGVDMSSRGEITVIEATAIDDQKKSAIVDKFVLANNYPNPFNPVTNINYHVPSTSDVSLVVYNSVGQKVRTLVDGSKHVGDHSVKWNGTNDAGQMLPSGLYFYKLSSGSTSLVKKMLFVK